MSQETRAPLSNGMVAMALGEFLGAETATSLVKSEVIEGAHVKTSADALGSCSHLDQIEMARFESGYDMNGSEKNIKVLPGSQAEQAGLHDGQEVLDKRFVGAIPWHLIELKVRDDHGVRWIRYLPQRKQASIWLPMYSLNDDAYKTRCPSF